MGFSMRMNLNGEIVKKKSFKSMYINGAKTVLNLMQLGYYRGHYFVRH